MRIFFIEVDTSGLVLRSVPTGGGVAYAGMAANSGRVFAAGGGQGGRLSELDSSTLSIINSRPMPSTNSVGLAYDGLNILTNNLGELIARDVDTLEVIYSFQILDEFTEGVAVEAVPEPYSAVIAALGSLAVLFRRIR